ncbi:MAG TPA: hypothetical protein VE870_11670 [Bacteroidales bacterium]|nr:hypothetical protein [Bacteroidales bacterium]
MKGAICPSLRSREQTVMAWMVYRYTFDCSPSAPLDVFDPVRPFGSGQWRYSIE